MRSMIAKLVGENQRDWDEKLPAVAFVYRASEQQTTGFTPYFLMFGREARAPADLVYGPPLASPHPLTRSPTRQNSASAWLTHMRW